MFKAFRLVMGRVDRRKLAVMLLTAALALFGGAFAQAAGFDIAGISGEAVSLVGEAGGAAQAYVPAAILLMLGIRWAYKIFG